MVHTLLNPTHRADAPANRTGGASEPNGRSHQRTEQPAGNRATLSSQRGPGEHGGGRDKERGGKQRTNAHRRRDGTSTEEVETRNEEGSRGRTRTGATLARGTLARRGQAEHGGRSNRRATRNGRRTRTGTAQAEHGGRSNRRATRNGRRTRTAAGRRGERASRGSLLVARFAGGSSRSVRWWLLPFGSLAPPVRFAGASALCVGFRSVCTTSI